MAIKKSPSEVDVDKAFIKYKPNLLIRKAYKYFSASTTQEDMKPSGIIFGILLALFVGGFGATIFELEEIGKQFTIVYGLSLLIMVLFVLLASIMNNNRLRKIRKHLKISKKEYIDLINLYY